MENNNLLGDIDKKRNEHSLKVEWAKEEILKKLQNGDITNNDYEDRLEKILHIEHALKEQYEKLEKCRARLNN